jgi:hypothetical protein
VHRKGRAALLVQDSETPLCDRGEWTLLYRWRGLSFTNLAFDRYVHGKSRGSDSALELIEMFALHQSTGLHRLTFCFMFLTLPGLAVAETPAEADAAEPSIKFSGFIDASANATLSGGPEGADFIDGFSMGVDQVEFDVEAKPSDLLTVRTDLNFFPVALLASDDNLVEQAYAEYSFGDSGVFLQAGKRNAPVGIEAIDPTDMYQYSSGLLFTNATPSNLTGLFTGWSDGSFTALVWATNDWDLPKTAGLPSTGGRLEYAYENGHVGLSSTYSLASEQLMVDADARLGFGDFTAFLEGNYGALGNTSTTGFLVKGNYALNESLSATVRYDNLTIGEVADQSVAVAVLLGLSDGLSGCAEVRADTGDSGDATTAAVELVATY